jgi:acyl carrier protein
MQVKKLNKLDELLDEALMEACEHNGVQFSDIKSNDNLDLIHSGLFDSMAFMQLLTHIEDELSIEIDFSELQPEEFTKLKSLRELISKLIA